jgi:hypothetical protein
VHHRAQGVVRARHGVVTDQQGAGDVGVAQQRQHRVGDALEQRAPVGSVPGQEVARVVAERDRERATGPALALAAVGGRGGRQQVPVDVREAGVGAGVLDGQARARLEPRQHRGVQHRLPGVLVDDGRPGPGPEPAARPVVVELPREPADRSVGVERGRGVVRCGGRGGVEVAQGAGVGVGGRGGRGRLGRVGGAHPRRLTGRSGPARESFPGVHTIAVKSSMNDS